MDKIKLTAEDKSRIDRIFAAEGCKPAIEGSVQLVPSSEFEGETALQFKVDGNQMEGVHANKVLFKHGINERARDDAQEVKTGKITGENICRMDGGFAVCEITLKAEGGIWTKDEPEVYT